MLRFLSAQLFLFGFIFYYTTREIALIFVDLTSTDGEVVLFVMKKRTNKQGNSRIGNFQFHEHRKKERKK